MTATELIAEMADAIYTLVPTCFCYAKHCSQCANWEAAKKLVDQAATFAADLKTRRGSDGKKPPQGGSVNTPRPPQDTTALPWQPGPAAGGGLPPESAEVILTLYQWSMPEWLIFLNDGNRWKCDQLYFDKTINWHLVEKWLIIK